MKYFEQTQHVTIQVKAKHFIFGSDNSL